MLVREVGEGAAIGRTALLELLRRDEDGGGEAADEEESAHHEGGGGEQLAGAADPPGGLVVGVGVVPEDLRHDCHPGFEARHAQGEAGEDQEGHADHGQG
ncbi:hypothetical protein GCM10020000_02640 [Streptomyces olivoverticillatus]